MLFLSLKEVCVRLPILYSGGVPKQPPLLLYAQHERMLTGYFISTSKL